MKLSKKKATSKTDNNNENPLEENINIDQDTNTGVVNDDKNDDKNEDKNEDISILQFCLRY